MKIIVHAAIIERNKIVWYSRQFNSSERSKQSFTPLHRALLSTHCSFLHLNCDAVQAGKWKKITWKKKERREKRRDKKISDRMEKRWMEINDKGETNISNYDSGFDPFRLHLGSRSAREIVAKGESGDKIWFSCRTIRKFTHDANKV